MQKEQTKEIINKKLQLRIKKISGQINGIEAMINNGRECDEVIQQIIAVRSALASLGIEVILENNDKCEIGKTKPVDMKRYLTNIFKLS